MKYEDIKEALAQPEQEPVGEVEQIDIDDEGTASAWFTIATEPLNLGDKLYTTPPQRTWVGLTDEQVIKTFNALCNGKPFEIARILELHKAIEAKLREKNHD